MIDGNRRNIDYLRISVTDRCNLRCVYCMPEEGVEWIPHKDILRYDEVLRLCRIFADLGITKFKITGGEPLVRKGIEELVAGIKAIPTTQSVTITTNGVLLAQQLPALINAGLDGVNISLDTLNREKYAAITRRDELDSVLKSLEASLAQPNFNVKLNCVPMGGGEEDWVALAGLAKDNKLSVRFIELMPIGLGSQLSPCTEKQVKSVLEDSYGQFTPFDLTLGNGPCRYFSAEDFKGKIGFISALSHQFCSSCNRVRLTSTGFLKTCLQYETGVELTPVLKENDETIKGIISLAIGQKPKAHQFTKVDVNFNLSHIMSQIGG